ncbi:uncharacterized protein L969DRAFT_89074 [Mixia osmundae IAM 14324]|nr:uncharacterized protein L969DRAFT_89074 [Mixia osmundae IAM 14324]KEI37846.1 hypothetical protein L969DRAFT_89074 [Mixia osmundae IAM 14324]
MVTRDRSAVRMKNLRSRNAYGFKPLPNPDAVDKKEGTGYYGFHVTNSAFDQGMWDTADSKWKRCCRAQAAFNVSLGTASDYVSSLSTVSAWIECGGPAASSRRDCSRKLTRNGTCSAAFHTIADMPISDIDVPKVQVYQFYFQASGQCRLGSWRTGGATWMSTTMGPMTTTLVTVSLPSSRSIAELINFDGGRFYAAVKEINYPGTEQVTIRFAVTLKEYGMLQNNWLAEEEPCCNAISFASIVVGAYHRSASILLTGVAKPMFIACLPNNLVHVIREGSCKLQYDGDATFECIDVKRRLELMSSSASQ